MKPLRRVNLATKFNLLSITLILMTAVGIAIFVVKRRKILGRINFRGNQFDPKPFSFDPGIINSLLVL